jgi:hypothetical protein
LQQSSSQHQQYTTQEGLQEGMPFHLCALPNRKLRCK